MCKLKEITAILLDGAHFKGLYVCYINLLLFEERCALTGLTLNWRLPTLGTTSITTLNIYIISVNTIILDSYF